MHPEADRFHLFLLVLAVIASDLAQSRSLLTDLISTLPPLESLLNTAASVVLLQHRMSQPQIL